MKFELRHEQTNKRFSFTVDTESVGFENLDFLYNDEPYASSFEEFVVDQEIKNKGVLDGEGDNTTIGYCSYEIPLSKFPKVLAAFHKWFKDNGIKIGPMKLLAKSKAKKAK